MGILDKMEDKFLYNKFVEDKWPENVYYSVYRLYNRIDDNLYKPFKNFFYNLVKYRRFLAKDYWWDSYFVFKILRDKLKKDAFNYRRWGITTKSDEYADQMEHCVEILDRITKDEYEKIEMKPHDEKWGEINFDGDIKEIFSRERPNVKTEEDKKIERAEFGNHMEVAWEKKVKDVDDLFDHMKKHILRWWD